MSTLKSINVVHPSSATNNIVNDASGNVAIGNNLTVAGAGTVTGTLGVTGALTGSSTIADSIGNVRTVPLNIQVTSYSLSASDAGKLVRIAGGYNVATTNTLTEGQTITIFNNSASSITITQGTNVVMTLVGTANTGDRTLAQYGLCTLVCWRVSGPGVFLVATGGGLT